MLYALPVLCLGPDPMPTIGGAGSTVVTYECALLVHQKRKDWSSECFGGGRLGCCLERWMFLAAVAWCVNR